MTAINEIKSPYIIGRSCLFSAFRVIALFFSRQYSEPIIHSLSGGWEVLYDCSNVNGIPLIFPDIKYCVSQFTKNCGLSYFLCQREFVKGCITEMLPCGNKLFLAIINLSILPNRNRGFDSVIKDEQHAVIIYGLENDMSARIYDPYLVNGKGEVETLFYEIPLDILCNGMIECYCIEKARDILAENIIEMVQDKISRFFNLQKVNNIDFGYAACLALSRDLRNGCFYGKQLVQMAFMIKTSLFYTLDFIHDIYVDCELVTRNNMDDKIRNQKKAWNSMYYKLLRKGYTDKTVLRDDEKEELANQLYDTFLQYKDLFYFLVR